jgi:hypothetical protein
MQWSQLKKRIEATFAESVQGRVEVWATRYRHASDQDGEAWITFDKQRLISMGTWTYEKEAAEARIKLRKDSGCTDYKNPEHKLGYYAAYNQADEIVKAQGHYPLWDTHRSFFEYLSLSIEEILASENSVIKTLGMLDKRFGKRRLKVFNAEDECILVKKLYQCRAECEGLLMPSSPLQTDCAPLNIAR